MPDIRERKQGELLKGRGEGKPASVKDFRQQMTAKYLKKLTEQRQTADSEAESVPESEAVDQVQETAQDAARSVQKHTENAFFRVTQQDRRETVSPKQQEPHRPEMPSIREEHGEQPPPRPPWQSEQGTIPHSPESGSSEPQRPPRREAASSIREPPQRSYTRPERSAKEPKRESSAVLPRERMRQKAIREKRTKQAEQAESHSLPEIRENVNPIRERNDENIPARDLPKNKESHSASPPPQLPRPEAKEQPAPFPGKRRPWEQPPASNTQPERTSQRTAPEAVREEPAQRNPRQRMRQQTLKEQQAQHIEIREREIAPKERPDPVQPHERQRENLPAIREKQTPGREPMDGPQASPRKSKPLSVAQMEQPEPGAAPADAPKPARSRAPQGAAPQKQTLPGAPSPKERFRLFDIKEKKAQTAVSRKDISYPKERPVSPQGENAPTPPAPTEQPPAGKTRPVKLSGPAAPQKPSGYPSSVRPPTAQPPAPPIPSPQKRMQANAQRQSAEVGRQRPPRLELPPKPPLAIQPIPENRSVFPENQSINPSIKERPRRGVSPKEKQAGGAFVPKTRQNAVIQKRTAKQATPITAARGKGAGPQIMEKARRRIQRNVQHKMLQNSKKTAKAAGTLTKKTVEITAKAAKALISALAGLLGGGLLIPVIIVVILVAAIIASPFGILFSNEPTPNAMPLNVAIGQIRREFSNKLEELQDGEYDDIQIEGQPPDWREVVAVFAAKTAGADDGLDVAALTPDRVELLRAVFWDMCVVTSEVETTEYPDSDPDDEVDDSYTESVLKITITAKTAEDMRTEYSFNDNQNSALTELIAELATMEILVTDLTASEEQARELKKKIPDDLAPERRAVVETACELVGKVTYFWGGKSLVIGWDNRWGIVTKVTAPDSPTTGTYRPYGLDCSGFVDWIFYNATDGAYYPGRGGGTNSQLAYSTQISWAEAQPGDLVFYSDVSHVGIVGGKDADGNFLIIHCTSGSINGTTITGAGGFGIVARPTCFTQ